MSIHRLIFSVYFPAGPTFAPEWHFCEFIDSMEELGWFPAMHLEKTMAYGEADGQAP